MGTTNDKLTYMLETKNQIKNALINKGSTITDNTPFREYPVLIENIPNGGSGTSNNEFQEWTQQDYETLYNSELSKYPVEWLKLQKPVDDNEEVVRILVNIENHESNFVAFYCDANFTVDWGDGVIEEYDSNIIGKAQHVYNYSNTNLNSDTISKYGYKQTIITIKPINGTTINTLIFDQFHSTIGSSTAYDTTQQFLGMLISAPNLNTLEMGTGLYTNFNTLEYFYLGKNNLTSTYRLLYGCTNLTMIERLYTDNVGYMGGMFSGCKKLVTIPMMNTNKVLDLTETFENCHSLITIPLIDTVNVDTTFNMFINCPSLVSIPLINTINVTNMSNMFSKCTKLKTIPLFNTSKATNMTGVFQSCTALVTIPLIDTSAVNTMANMFYGCSSLVSIPLLNTINVTTMANMFYGCFALKEIPLLNTSNVTVMMNTFVSCYSLTTIPLLDTSKVTNTTSMFTSCYGLVSIPLINTINVTIMSNMFNGCKSLITVPLLNTSKVTSVSQMFANCVSLVEVPLFDLSVVTTTAQMFQGCTALIKVPNFNLVLNTTVQNMFMNCLSLKEVPAFSNLPVVTAMGSFLFGCYNIRRIKTPLKFTSDITYLKLSSTELNEIYTNLPVKTGQVLTVTGNWGIASDNPTIATSKGWSVVG